jgi:hypothetical protein
MTTRSGAIYKPMEQQQGTAGAHQSHRADTGASGGLLLTGETSLPQRQYPILYLHRFF